MPDNRSWFATIVVQNDMCPYLFYLDGYNKCQLLSVNNNDCCLENCNFYAENLYVHVTSREVVL